MIKLLKGKRKIVYVILAIMLVLVTWYSLKEKGITATASDSEVALAAEEVEGEEELSSEETASSDSETTSSSELSDEESSESTTNSDVVEETAETSDSSELLGSTAEETTSDIATDEESSENAIATVSEEVSNELVSATASDDGIAVASDAIAYASVTDSEPSTDSQAVNIYMYIDGEWTFVGTTSTTSSQSWGWNTSYTLSQSNVLSVINETLSLGLTSLSGYTVYYNTSTDSTTVTKLNTGNGPNSSNYTVSTSNYINVYITDYSVNGNGNNIALSTVESNNNLKVTSFTITEYDTDGRTQVSSNTVYTLGDSYSYTLSEDYNYYVNDSTELTYGGTTIEITGNTKLVRVQPKTYTVTVIYANGTTETVSVREGQTYTLGNNMKWKVGNSSEYTDGGTEITVTEDITVTESSEITIIYTVDTTAAQWYVNDGYQTIEYEIISYITTNNGTTYTISVNYNDGTTTETLTSDYMITAVYGTFRYVSEFSGWAVNSSSTVVNDFTELSWDDLYSYAVNGVVNFTTTWTQITSSTEYVNFYLQLYSEAVDIDGSVSGQPTSNYTPSLWASYVGNYGSTYDGTNYPPIADTTADNSYTADQTIRSLEGEKDGYVYIYEIPDDEYIFSQLKAYVDSGYALYVDDILVDVDELDSDHYAIRWYVFKSQSDGWHVDGKLVRREGKVTITKTFTGSKAAIESVTGYSFDSSTQGSSSYYVTVSGGSSEQAFYLTSADYAVNSTTTSGDSTTYTLTYTWIVNIKYGIDYSVTESNYEVTDYEVIAEYNIVDPYSTEYTKVYNSDGTYYYATDDDGNFVASYTNQSTSKKQTLGTATFTGVNNYDLDNTSAFDYTKVLTVNLSNNYVPTTAITIKKVDSITNNGLKDAQFSLYNVDSEGNATGEALKFTYNESIYTYNESGTVTVLTSPTGGSIVIDGLKNGTYLLKEITNPDGYTSSVEITLTATEDSNGNGVIVPVITKGTGSDYDSEEKYIEVDNVSKLTTVSVTKTWDYEVPEDYQKDVVVQLYLNGKLISNYDLSYDLNGDGTVNEDDKVTAEVTLNSNNSWTYEWANLPLYIDGEKAVYTVKEIKIGDISAATTGSFDSDGNWYSDDAYTQYVATTSRTETTENGEVTKISIDLENTIHLIKISINKITPLGNELEDVTFKLQKYDDEGNLIDVATGKTLADGSLTFADLEYGVKYVLTETAGVNGYYIGDDPIYIIINKQDNSTDILKIYTDLTYEIEASTSDYESGGYYEYVSLNDSQDVLTIINIPHSELPKAGGIGTHGFYILGISIMTLCLGIRIYLKKSKKI